MAISSLRHKPYARVLG